MDSLVLTSCGGGGRFYLALNHSILSIGAFDIPLEALDAAITPSFFIFGRRLKIILSFRLLTDATLKRKTIQCYSFPSKKGRSAATAFFDEISVRRTSIPAEVGEPAIVHREIPSPYAYLKFFPLLSFYLFIPFIADRFLFLLPVMLFILAAQGVYLFIIKPLKMPKLLRQADDAKKKGNYVNALAFQRAFDGEGDFNRFVAFLPKRVMLLEFLGCFATAADELECCRSAVDPEMYPVYRRNLEIRWRISERKTTGIILGAGYPGQPQLETAINAFLEERGVPEFLKANGFIREGLCWKREYGRNITNILLVEPLREPPEEGHILFALHLGIMLPELYEALNLKPLEGQPTFEDSTLRDRFLFDSESPLPALEEKILPLWNAIHSINHFYAVLCNNTLTNPEHILCQAASAFLIGETEMAGYLFGQFEHKATPYWRKRARVTAAFLAKKGKT